VQHRPGQGAESVIAGIDCRLVLNTHLEWTPEFFIRLADGRGGRGAPPRADTPSIYEEDAAPRTVAHDQVAAWARAALVGRRFHQESLDQELAGHRAGWGRAACFALSAAFFEARFSGGRGSSSCPRLVFNVLNGGLHAYSLPVTSDFTELLLVPNDTDPARSIDGYRRLLHDAHAALAEVPRRRVGDHLVHDLGPDPNEAALSLLTDLLDHAGLSDAFGVMIDASAGDWLRADKYVLPVSGHRFDRAELVHYWLNLVSAFDVKFLEDPLAETDLDGWAALHTVRPPSCRLLGDNFTSTSAAQLAAKADHVDGVLLKPDQIGSISEACRFACLARDYSLPVIGSARSVETGSPLITHVALELGLDYLKVGPYQDFSAVMRTNELLRSRSS
jgi:enolase